MFNESIRRKYGSKKGLLLYLKYRFLSLISPRLIRSSKIPDDVARIVFVCKGNICRSVVAEYVFKSLSKIPVSSFGLDTDSGKPANPRIAKLVGLHGYDLEAHKSTRVQDFVAEANDLFVCMEPEQAREVEKRFNTKRVILLGAFGAPKRLYLHDPYAATAEYAKFCTAFLIQATKDFVSKVGGDDS